MPTQPHKEPGERADGSGHAPYEHASDDESYDIRPSAELSDDDHDILESEDEREKLLTQRDGIAGLFGSAIKIGKRGGGAKQPEMKERKRSQNTEASALMYGLEEGIGGSSSSLLRSRRSSESDEQRLLASQVQKKACSVARRINKANGSCSQTEDDSGGELDYTCLLPPSSRPCWRSRTASPCRQPAMLRRQ
jgi:hypothetical protein